jgi:hypothetical protein
LSVVNNWEKALISVTFVLLFVMRLAFFRAAKQQENKIDSELITPNDFTIIVKQLPKNITPEQIFQKFGFLSTGQKVRIHKINFTYNIGEFVELVQKKSDASLELTRQTKSKTPNFKKINKLRNELQ